MTPRAAEREPTDVNQDCGGQRGRRRTIYSAGDFISDGDQLPGIPSG